MVELDYDCVLVGAGFSGIHMLYRLRNEMDMKCKLIDLTTGPGGTWYHNRYPGAMSDTESFLYRYAWDVDFLKEWPWAEKYSKQKDIIEYLNHVVDRYDLRKYMQFSTEMMGAWWNDDEKYWSVEMQRKGESKTEVVTCRYLFSHLGILSAVNMPDIPGLKSYQGKLIHTAKWPEGYSLKGKTVGIIGNGSTGVQVITAIAPEVKSLVCFQRHPQYSVPARDGPTDPKFKESVDASWPQWWDRVRHSAFGFASPESKVPAMSVSAEEREAIYEAAWQRGGGFNFMFGTFGDIAIDEAANETACDFIRRKIAKTVKDPEKARKLQPHDYYARRPLMDGGYFERFNQDNVDIVLLTENPIDEIVPEGIRLADGTVHKMDVLIMSTGFEAVEGSYTRVKFRGRNGVTIKDRWEERPKSYLGVYEAQFPNFCITMGPHGPFANVPPCIEAQIDFIMKVLKKVNGKGTFEVTEEAEAEWVEKCDSVAEHSLFSRLPSWFMGANSKNGKKYNRFFLEGIARYREETDKIVAADFKGMKLTPAQ